jgi:hypothetical protein
MRTCIARKQNGTYCTYRAKYGTKCGYHREDGYHKNKNNIRRVDDDDSIKTTIASLFQFIYELNQKMDAALLVHASHDHEIMKIKDDVIGLVRHLTPLTKSIDMIAQTLMSLPIVGRFVT